MAGGRQAPMGSTLPSDAVVQWCSHEYRSSAAASSYGPGEIAQCDLWFIEGNMGTNDMVPCDGRAAVRPDPPVPTDRASPGFPGKPGIPGWPEILGR
jgi:hypothetical protein